MASEYDGSVKLAATFDTTYIKKSAQELRKEMDKAFDTTSTMKATKEVDKLRYSIKSVAREYDEVTKKMKELEATKVPTEAYKELMDEFDQLSAKLGPLTEKQLQMKEAGKTNTKEWHKLGIEIGTLTADIDTLQQKMTQLRKNNAAFTSGTQTKEYQDYLKKADDLANKMRILKQRTDEQNESQNKSTKTYKAVSTVVQTLGNDIKKLTSHIKNAVKNLIKMTGSAITNGLKNLASHFGLLSKHSDNAGISMGKLFKKILAYGFGIRSIYVLFRKLRSAISDGLKSMAEMNGGMNPLATAINELQTSLQYLKNSLATAFAPIVTYVVPIITTLVDKLAQSIQMIGAFLSAVQGVSSYTKAIRTPYVSKEADKAEKADIKAQNTANKKAAKEDLKQRKEAYKKEVAELKAAQKARNKEISEAERTNKQVSKNNAKVAKNTALRNLNTKAIQSNTNALKKQKGELAGFDDLDVLGQEADNDTSLQNLVEVPPELTDAIEDFNDALAETPELVQDVAEAFEEAKIPDWINELANTIRGFISRGDWYGLGQFMGEKLNSLIKTVDDWINNVARPKGVEWATNIAQLLNGLVAGVDWQLLGKTVADGFNTIFDITYTFLTTFDFLKFGQAIGQAILSWFENIDWELLGSLFAAKWNALIHFIQGIVTTPDLWSTIGTSIATFLRSAIADIDIDGIATTFIALFNGIFEMLGTFLANNPFEGLGRKLYDGINRLIHEIDWYSAGRTLSNLVVQLLSVFREVAENTDWEGFGRAIGEFLEGIDWAGILGSVASIIWEVVSGIIKGFLSTDSGKAFLAIVAGIEGLKLAFTLGSKLLLPAVEKVLITGLTNVLTGGLSGIFSAAGSLISGAFSSVISLIGSAGGAIVSGVTSLISSIGSALMGIITFIGPTGLIILACIALAALITAFIVTHWEDIKKMISDIIAGLGKLLDSAIEVIQSAIDGIATIFKTAINFYISLWEGFLNGIIWIVNAVISAINLLHIDVPDWVPLLGGQTIGFNIPTIPEVKLPKLAQGAVIPPNREFLAMLGDQTSGTNIEAPLDTIVDAFREVVGNLEVQNTGSSIMTVDGQVFARLMTPYVVSELGRRGYDVKILEA